MWLIAHRWTPRVLAFFVLAALPLLAAAPASGERRSRFEAASGPSDARNARLGALSDPGAPGGAFLGIQVRDAPGSAGGALVAAVVPGAPGDKAGIREGDIIVSLFGTPVTGAAQFARAASALQVGLPYPLEVIRGEARLTLTVRPAARPSRFAAPSPGGQQPGQRPSPPPRRGPLDINVLKYAFIEPATGDVTFVGRYDPQFDTGPIPYADLFEEALQHPYPAFSLDPTPQSEKTFQEADRKLAEEFKRMKTSPEYADQWSRKVFDLLLNGPGFEADRKRLLDRVSRVMGISAAECQRMYAAATGKLDIPATEKMALASKMLAGLGYDRAARAAGVLSKGGAPDALVFGMCKELDLLPQYEKLVLRGLDPQSFHNESIILAISEVCRSFGASESRMQEIIDGVRAGRRSVNDLIDYMNSLMWESISSRYGAAMLNGVVLGPEILSRLFGLPAPRVQLVFKDVPPDSLLGEVLFRADYALKSISSYPDAREVFPEHLTSQEYLWMREDRSGVSVPSSAGGGMGCTLVPSGVQLTMSPDGSVVAFGDSKIRVDGWLRELFGIEDDSLVSFLREMCAGYGAFLTENYAAYARFRPELHTLSEAAKVLALARSVRESGRRVRAPGATGRKVSLPRETEGFWTAVFHVTGQSASLTFVQEGGADFSRQSGDSWIARQTDPAVITDVTRQLAASAAFAETAMKEAIAGNLEAARDLAERSAKAMTGELDLTGLPPVEAAIEPRSVAAFGAANASLVEETHRALDELMQAQSEMARAQAVASSSPEEAARIRRDAEAVQDKALEKFRQLVAAAGVLRSDPRQASAVAITLSSLNAVVAPPAAPGTSAGPVAAPQSAAASAGRPAPATPEEWKDRVSAWRKELEETERQIEATREALLRLNRSILQNAQLFEEWERSSDEAFARCVETAGSLAIDFGIEGLSGRYETIYGLARKLPAPPQALLEKYRHLVEMVQRLKESKAVLDASSLVERENESPGEVLETIRDGIGQITGLLNLDKTVPGAAWKYGSLFFDNLYNLAELYHTWKNVTALERSNDQLAEGVRRLSERLKDLRSRSRELRRKIEEAGEDAGSGG